MNNYISIIELEENSNDFAERIGVLAIEPKRYVCIALNSENMRLNNQIFCLEKSIEGVPPNNKSLSADLLKAWTKHLEKLSKIRNNND